MKIELGKALEFEHYEDLEDYAIELECYALTKHHLEICDGKLEVDFTLEEELVNAKNLVEYWKKQASKKADIADLFRKSLHRVREDLTREYGPYRYSQNFKYIDEAFDKTEDSE